MSLALQAVYELATQGRLSPETDYDVRDELDLVPDEEREAHDKAEADAAPAKPSQDETSNSTTVKSATKPGGNK
jgi:hypothetical protein